MSFGRLERTQGAQPFSEINVTPLVDVMLVLVVIFIITAPLLASSIRLDLPKSDAAKPNEAPQFITLAVDKSGQAFLNDKAVSAEQLEQRLAEAASRNPDTELQLRADATVPYGKVIALMGVAQKTGLSRIGFVAEPADAAQPPAR